MIHKAEMIIEQFENGITIRWKATESDGNYPTESKNVAPIEKEAESIGREIWDDLCEIGAGKVLVKLEYQIMED